MARSQPDRDRRVVEVTGLPGVGKTSVCQALLARDPDARRSWVARQRRWLQSSLVRRLAVPVVFVRYYRVSRALIAAATPSLPAERWPRARAFARLVCWPEARLRDSQDPTLACLFLLCVFVTEFDLARGEAWLRGRVLVSDEGYLHRTLGLSLRVPDAARERVVAAFLDAVPHTATCLVLRCPPALAHARARGRSRGVPKILRRAAEGSDEAGDAPVAALYARLDALLDDARVREHIWTRDVNANDSAGEVARRVQEALLEIRAPRPLLVFLRD